MVPRRRPEKKKKVPLPNRGKKEEREKKNERHRGRQPGQPRHLPSANRTEPARHGSASLPYSSVCAVRHPEGLGIVPKNQRNRQCPPNHQRKKASEFSNHSNVSSPFSRSRINREEPPGAKPNFGPTTQVPLFPGIPRDEPNGPQRPHFPPGILATAPKGPVIQVVVPNALTSPPLGHLISNRRDPFRLAQPYWFCDRARRGKRLATGPCFAGFGQPPAPTYRSSWLVVAKSITVRYPFAERIFLRGLLASRWSYTHRQPRAVVLCGTRRHEARSQE